MNLHEDAKRALAVLGIGFVIALYFMANYSFDTGLVYILMGLLAFVTIVYWKSKDTILTLLILACFCAFWFMVNMDFHDGLSVVILLGGIITAYIYMRYKR